MATKKFNVTVNGTSYEVEVEEIKIASGSGAPKTVPVSPSVTVPTTSSPVVKTVVGVGEHSIDAPMPGKVVKLVAVEGAAVKAGEVLLILEAMKMQNEITADSDGVVKKFNVSAGQNVKAHESLVIIG